MKTLQEIKDEYAKEVFGYDWDAWTDSGKDISNEDVNEVAKRFAVEVSKEALKNASERDGCIFHENRKAIKYVAQELVLDESNIPQL